MQAGGQGFDSLILHFFAITSVITLIDILQNEKRVTEEVTLIQRCIESNDLRLNRLSVGSDASGNKSDERNKRKGAWRMPRLLEAKKDVISCEKRRGSANTI